MPFEDIKEHSVIFSNYLFAGPDLEGAALAAKNFAKALNCLNEEAKPCDACASCKKIDSQTHPDVFLIEPKGASSSINIDMIRGVINRANLKPYEGRKKVFIIADARSMNITASNAFLKTLEEPPADTVFILISNSEKALLPTIVSRCHIIKFSAAQPKFIKVENLKDFVGALGVYSNREELKGKLESLLSYFRDMLLYKTIGDEKMLFHAEIIDELKKTCERFTTGDLEFLVERVITLRSYVDYNVNPRLIVDVLVNDVTALQTA